MTCMKLVLIGTLAATASTLALAQAAGAGADFNKKEREQLAAQKKGQQTQQKTYTEAEIRASVPKEPAGKTTDVRRVGTPNGSTLDKPAKKQ